MLDSFWHWFVIIGSIANILACWWLLRWSAKTKVNQTSNNTTGHVWDEDLQELNNPLPRWWLGLFYISIVFALAYLFFYPGLGNYKGSLGWTQVSQLEENIAAAESEIAETQKFWNDYSNEDLATNRSVLETGKRIFANNCAMCHGSGGQGATGYPNLADADWQWGQNFDQLVDIITNGRTAAMMPWIASLGEDGVKEVSAYVRKLGGLEHDATTAEAGMAHYNKTCIGCHGPTGNGLQALGAPNLTDKYWLYGSDDETLYETIAKGRRGQMPAHKDLLNKYRIRAVTAYVMSLSKKPETDQANAKSN